MNPSAPSNDRPQSPDASPHGGPSAPGLPELPGLDVAGALRRVSHDPELYMRLLRRFVAGQRDCDARIEAALAAGLPHDAERLAHTLRGSAANLGATALQEAAGAVEAALRGDADAGTLGPHLARLSDTLRQLVALIDTRLPPPREDTASASLDDAAFDAEVATLLALLEAADGAAPAALRRLRPDLATRFGLEDTAKIATAIRHYDYDEALACLRQAIHQRRIPKPGA